MDNHAVVRALDEIENELPKIEEAGSRFSVMRSLGFARDEVYHSRLLAGALSPKSNASAEALVRPLVADLLSTDLPASHKQTYRRFLADDAWKTIRVWREFRHIDLVVTIKRKNEEELVLGIENKIDAGEQRHQVSRYQRVLEESFPKAICALLFLTPDGRPPKTGRDSHEVPWVSVSYRSVVTALEKAVDESGADKSVGLREVTEHVREEILGEDPVVETARRLWKKYPQALKKILEYRPRLGDIADRYANALEAELGHETLLISRYPTTGQPREIKAEIKSWTDIGFRFVFVLHEEDGLPRSRIRVFIREKDYRKHKAALEGWASQVDAKVPGLIDPEFRSVRGWTNWRRVFLEQDYPDSAALETTGFDSNTVQEAVERVRNLYDQLSDHIPAQG